MNWIYLVAGLVVGAAWFAYVVLLTRDRKRRIEASIREADEAFRRETESMERVGQSLDRFTETITRGLSLFGADGDGQPGDVGAQRSESATSALSEHDVKELIRRTKDRFVAAMRQQFPERVPDVVFAAIEVPHYEADLMRVLAKRGWTESDLVILDVRMGEDKEDLLRALRGTTRRVEPLGGEFYAQAWRLAEESGYMPSTHFRNLLAHGEGRLRIGGSYWRALPEPERRIVTAWLRREASVLP